MTLSSPIRLHFASADFIHHQYISYLVIANTNPMTGAGIANVYETYWRGAFIESYMVAVTQPIIVGYFIGRCYGVSASLQTMSTRGLRKNAEDDHDTSFGARNKSSFG